MKHVYFGVFAWSLIACGPAVSTSDDATANGSTSGEQTTVAGSTTGSSEDTSGGEDTIDESTSSGIAESSSSGLGSSSGDHESSDSGDPTLCVAPWLDPNDRLQVDGSPMRGNADGLVTIVQWLGYREPFSRNVYTTIEDLFEGPSGSQLRLVIKQMPFDFHDPARRWARAGIAAGQQDLFWEFHDAVFQYEDELEDETLDEIALSAGLDLDLLHEAMLSEEVEAQLEADEALFNEYEVGGTPGFSINGRVFAGALLAEDFESIVAEALTAMETRIDDGQSQCEAYANELDTNLP